MSLWKSFSLGFLLNDIKKAMMTIIMTKICKNPAKIIKEFSSFKASPPYILATKISKLITVNGIPAYIIFLSIEKGFASS